MIKTLKACVILPIFFLLHLLVSLVVLPYYDKNEVFPVSNWYLFSVPFQTQSFYFLQAKSGEEWETIPFLASKYFWSFQKIGKSFQNDFDHKLQKVELEFIKSQLNNFTEFRIIFAKVEFASFKETKQFLEKKIIFENSQKVVH